jgi:2-oxoglutarate dehydrogenase E1 component
MAEFEGAQALERVKRVAALPHGGTGDVKYHHGAEGLFTTADGETIKIRLYPNPSHLEFVDPVVTGGTRAAQTSHSGPILHHNPERAVPRDVSHSFAEDAKPMVFEANQIGECIVRRAIPDAMNFHELRRLRAEIQTEAWVERAH